MCGCLSKISPERLKEVQGNALVTGPSLQELAKLLSMQAPASRFDVEEVPFNKFVSIIPIAKGCVGKCSYCAVKAARGDLKSFKPAKIEKKFRQAAAKNHEIWITAQDTGCYGVDIGESLVSLLKRLLGSTEDKCRIRVGMMNPNNLKWFVDDYLSLFVDERLYRFFHVPIQSGSNSVLGAMNRKYTAGEAISLCGKIRRAFPLASIATDLIVGFPGESESDFKKTLGLVNAIQPDVINISRFGARPNTAAALLSSQLHGREKKARSRELTLLHLKISLARNSLFFGREEEIFVSEIGQSGNFIGRNKFYKPIVVNKDVRGQFVKVKAGQAFPTYLVGALL